MLCMYVGRMWVATGEVEEVGGVRMDGGMGGEVEAFTNIL